MYEYRAELVRIIDGDTLELNVDLGFGVHKVDRFRLARINTPETYGVKKDSEEYQRGMLAKKAVEENFALAESITIETEKDKKGKYGRFIAEVFLHNWEGEWNLSDTLVDAELAEYVEY